MFRIPSLLEKGMFQEGMTTIVQIDIIFAVHTLNRKNSLVKPTKQKTN